MAFFSAAIAAVGGLFASVTAKFIGAWALQAVAGMGLSILVQKLAGKKSQSADFSVRGQIGRGADVSQAFVMGTFATAGTLTYANTKDEGGSPNILMYWAITLSDLPVKSLAGVWVNGARCETSPSAVAGWLEVDAFTVNGGENLRIRFYDGTQTTADSELMAASTPERTWDAAAVGRGRAYVVVRAYLNPDKFPNGFPSFLFEVEGVPLYNPALDFTVGGEGPQRWDDPSTWEVSHNPAVQLYNVLRGLRYGGAWFYGLQDVTAAQLPVAHWIGQINKCAALVVGASGPEPQFRASGEVPVASEIVGVVESLLTACNGRLSDAGGVYKLFAGAPDAPVISLTDDEILSTSEQSFTPFFGLSDTVNGVSGKYPSPDAAWQMEVPAPLYRPDYEAEDGGRRLLVDLSLDFVPYAEQAQRLMKSALNEARRARRHTLYLPPRFWVLEPGDVVAWSSTRNGYLAKSFRVDGMIDMPNGDVIVDVTEVDAADYDFVTAVDFTLPNPPGLAIQPITVQQLPGFAVYPSSIADGTGALRRPAIRAVWTAAVADIRAVKLEIRVKETGQLLPPTTAETVGLGEIYIADGILPLTEYEVRANLIPDGQRPTIWTPWLAVTTPDVRLGEVDLVQSVRDALAEAVAVRADVVAELDAAVALLRAETSTAIGTMPADITALINTLAAEVAARVAQGVDAAADMRGQRDDLRALVAEVVDAVAHSEQARDELRRSLTAQMGTFGAEFSERIIVLADEARASAVRITGLEATSGALAASINTVELALVDGLDATAALIAEVAVGSAVQFDHAQIWYFDLDVEGWTGSPTAPETTAQGWLRPGAGSFVASPTGLAVAGQAYAQVRARIRRVGAPVWLGELWWAGVGQAWDAARRVTAPAPTWDGDVANLTINPAWTGLIDAVRFDLATGDDASNYYELDWVAVGRPSPGASSADVAAERAARIAGDSAIALDVTTLQGRLTDAEGVQTGQAGALSGLTTRVDDTEAGIAAEATRIDTLDARIDGVDGVLDGQATALDSLTAEAFGADGSQIYQAGALRSLRSAVQALVAEGVDGRAAGHLATQVVRDYIAEASQSLNTRVDLTDGQVRLVAEAVTVLQAAIPGLATADALQSLSALVVQNAGNITATATALTALSAVVGTAQAAISSEATARATADNAIASTIATLSTTLGDTNATVTTQATALANVQGRLAARYLLEVAVDGSTATIEAVASADGVGGTLSIITLGSDVFRFAGNFAEFMGAVRIAGTLLVDDTIVASKIVDKSIVVPERYFSRQAIDITTHTAFVTLATLVIDRKSKAVEIGVNLTLSTPGGGEGFIIIEVVRNTFTSVGSMQTVSHYLGSAMQVAYSATDFGIGTGPATYTLRATLIPPAENPTRQNRPLRVSDVYFSLTSFVR